MKNYFRPLFQMEWIVNQAGYEVACPDAPTNLNMRKYLLGQTPGYRLSTAIVPKSKKWKTYNPFSKDNPGIAREFANIPILGKKLDEEAVIKFANEYGLLGLGLSDGKREENLDDWLDKVKKFKNVFREIDQDNGELAHLAFNQAGIFPRMNLAISPGNRSWKRSLEISPATLYGAMWIMTANEITIGTEMEPCQRENCPKWYRKKSNRRFCSDYCRVAENRRQIRRRV